MDHTTLHRICFTLNNANQVRTRPAIWYASNEALSYFLFPTTFRFELNGYFSIFHHILHIVGIVFDIRMAWEEWVEKTTTEVDELNELTIFVT